MMKARREKSDQEGRGGRERERRSSTANSWITRDEVWTPAKKFEDLENLDSASLMAHLQYWTIIPPKICTKLQYFSNFTVTSGGTCHTQTLDSYQVPIPGTCKASFLVYPCFPGPNLRAKRSSHIITPRQSLISLSTTRTKQSLSAPVFYCLLLNVTF